MRYVAVSQRVVSDPARSVRSDATDQDWWAFLDACRLRALPVPNRVDDATALVTSLPVSGVVLTGGNDLVPYGGSAPERDDTESRLLDLASLHGLPVLGVCRGMQLLQHRSGTRLHRVEGHVQPHQTVLVDGRERRANSYHRWGSTGTQWPFRVWATGPGEVVKGIEHRPRRLLGIMWHPERLRPFHAEDVDLFRRHFREAL